MYRFYIEKFVKHDVVLLRTRPSGKSDELIEDETGFLTPLPTRWLLIAMTKISLLGWWTVYNDIFHVAVTVVGPTQLHSVKL